MYWLVKPGRTGNPRDEQHSHFVYFVFCVCVCLLCFCFSLYVASFLRWEQDSFMRQGVLPAQGLHYPSTPGSGLRGKRRLSLLSGITLVPRKNSVYSHSCCVPMIANGSSTQDELCRKNYSSTQNVEGVCSYQKTGLRRLRRPKRERDRSQHPTTGKGWGWGMWW